MPVARMRTTTDLVITTYFADTLTKFTRQYNKNNNINAVIGYGYAVKVVTDT